MIEKRLAQFAADANVEQAGHMDSPQHHMKRMPPDLRGARKMTIGRHRVYWEGHHSKCSYRLFYVKPFKKTGVDDEDDPGFQSKLKKALRAPGERQLKESKSDEP